MSRFAQYRVGFYYFLHAVDIQIFDLIGLKIHFTWLSYCRLHVMKAYFRNQTKLKLSKKDPLILRVCIEVLRD